MTDSLKVFSLKDMVSLEIPPKNYRTMLEAQIPNVIDIRIRNKNIRKFCGKPIINYSIETALKSKLFKKIHISTNNLKIKKIIKKYPIKIDFFRPNKISGDKVGLMEVFKFVEKKCYGLERSSRSSS